MQIIIPMAGKGKRMRPHTLTTAKPLIPVAGKPIVQRLVEDITKVCGQKVNEIAFIIGSDFGVEVEQSLIKVAESQGAKGSIFYQDIALGTAHAIMCAKDAIKGKTVVAFADTLFKADFIMDTEQEGVIWVQKIDDPSQFGVVKLDEKGVISDFIEKPTTFISDLAIIGIYYFKDGDYLKRELQHLLDNNITEKGEFQLTNALENMKAKGTKFMPGQVTEWLDCGNKNATVYTNQRVLEFDKGKTYLKEKNIINNNSLIIEPCFIGENAEISNSIIGPHASIGANSKINNSLVKNSIVQKDSKVNNANVANSMLGVGSEVTGKNLDLSISDYTQIIV
ncbi:sugar phosphate nucleotidyltransferase [Sediminibacterium sp.]|uniref:sugar phosphate nucleotidyltransferase n=1 Tax=Sediminibacterium sp. TaxID=1917865 RepID=UPI0027357DD2|nr:sugar phosphate nucleotidyltransferase [Sediminibacterium sp.]MDP3567564.1 sugar phosphate nucleotidyltransferase [Sediminibacterium sp.]